MDILGVSLIGWIIATVGFMAVGFVWYGPLFGKKWMELNGFTPESFEGANMTLTMVKGVINSAVMAAFIGYVLVAVGAGDLVAHVKWAFLLWLGFSATTQALSHIWERQPLELTLIHWSNNLVGFLLAGLIFAFL
ncbi:MAG: DUF1761 domain-containing protein [Oceanicaulis sp.]|uniref:DUF1761 domain-containing protein n=1 Tax=Glycocaulis sp. TaxID=1969725 RepID=UPI0025C40438|nr:DUF1761 domain-containing protein [Glycocaulis sp.]MCC5981149.1 DUF1761 domain-containing protein [Oceanicaulis sp.]MCH8522471.1 DUF1761 domain-containing protein [Glycocaulis sp.]